MFHTIKTILKKIIYYISPIKCIFFESYPDYSDNTRPVFDEMVNRGLNKKYLLVWQVNDLSRIDNFPKIKNVLFLPKQSKKYQMLSLVARCYISCNVFLQKSIQDKQLMFFLTHGTPLKDTKDYFTAPKDLDYCFAAADKIIPVLSDSFRCPVEKIVSMGFPRNDVFSSNSKKSLSDIFGHYSKYVVWYPTFRQHKSSKGICAETNTLPIIHDDKAAEQLNLCAQKSDTLIIIKPHFAQDVSYIKKLNLSNVILIDDSLFDKNHITSYEFLSLTDALISDYSSVIYDYMLCNKPIALVWEDIENYKKNPGLIKDYEYFCKGCEKVYNVQELCEFIDCVSQGVDNLNQERNEICDVVNFSRDGKNTIRVVDFIIEKAKL